MWYEKPEALTFFCESIGRHHVPLLGVPLPQPHPQVPTSVELYRRCFSRNKCRNIIRSEGTCWRVLEEQGQSTAAWCRQVQRGDYEDTGGEAEYGVSGCELVCPGGLVDSLVESCLNLD
jgi:hypothetical protein